MLHEIIETKMLQKSKYSKNGHRKEKRLMKFNEKSKKEK